MKATVTNCQLITFKTIKRSARIRIPELKGWLSDSDRQVLAHVAMQKRGRSNRTCYFVLNMFRQEDYIAILIWPL